MGKSIRKTTGHMVNTARIDALAEILLMAKRSGAFYKVDLSMPSAPVIIFDNSFPIKAITMSPTEYTVLLVRWKDFFAPSKQP